MKRAVKGALLSGLILPGLGQLWLKHYLRGAALITAVSAAMAVIAVKGAQHAYQILEKAEREGAVDMVAIVNSATRASAMPDDWQTGTALAVLAICWIAGTLDAYLLGRKMDAEQEKRNTEGKLTNRRGGA